MRLFLQKNKKKLQVAPDAWICLLRPEMTDVIRWSGDPKRAAQVCLCHTNFTQLVILISLNSILSLVEGASLFILIWSTLMLILLNCIFEKVCLSAFVILPLTYSLCHTLVSYYLSHTTSVIILSLNSSTVVVLISSYHNAEKSISFRMSTQP